MARSVIMCLRRGDPLIVVTDSELDVPNIGVVRHIATYVRDRRVMVCCIATQRRWSVVGRSRARSRATVKVVCREGYQQVLMWAHSRQMCSMHECMICDSNHLVCTVRGCSAAGSW